MIEKIKKIATFIGQFAAGFLVFLFAGSCVYYPGKLVWDMAHGRYDGRTIAIMLLAWALVNLVMYQAISAAIAYAWEYRNRKNIMIHATAGERKKLMRRYGVATDEELNKIGYKPSIFGVLTFGLSFGPYILRDYLIEGPHIGPLPGEKTREREGFIRSRRFFDFAAMKGEPDNIRFFCLIFHPRYMPFTLVSGILGYLSLTLWCLMPFRRAVQMHFRKVNGFVAGFSGHTELKIEGEATEEDIKHIRALHEMIWNRLPYEDFFEQAKNVNKWL